jgi:release factor glutamine methyltransferase
MTEEATGVTPHSLLSAAIRRLEAAGVETPRLEAQLLLAHALCVSRLDILRGLDRTPTVEEIQAFEQLIAQREKRVPLAYLRGTQAFYGLDFEVSPAVLIPRPETELLVEFAIEKLRNTPGATLVDVGTGSGCIAVAAAVHLPEVRLLALDLSPDALALARRNARRHQVEKRVRFVQANLLEGVSAGRVEMIVSNPPYVTTAEVETLQPEVRDYEPRLALDGGVDGLVFQRGLIARARRVLRPGGWLGLEVALGQADAVAARLREAGFSAVETRRDLAGIERVVLAQKKV